MKSLFRNDRRFTPLTRPALLVACAALASACVSQGKYDAKVAELAATHAALTEERSRSAASDAEARAKSERLAAAQQQLDASKLETEALLAKLEAVNERATELERLAQDRQQVVSDLQVQLGAERKLLAEFAALAQAYGAETPEELKRSLAELQRRVQATESALLAAQADLDRERRIADKLKTQIDAGTLKVRRRAGRLVIELPGDVLFGAGSAKLTDVGKQTLSALGPVLSSEADRRFVVEGHTDNQPIHVSGFRSNWHLGATRAELARDVLVASGVVSNTVAIASWADLLPACEPVDDDACRQRNRRVEVLLLPRFE